MMNMERRRMMEKLGAAEIRESKWIDFIGKHLANHYNLLIGTCLSQTKAYSWRLKSLGVTTKTLKCRMKKNTSVGSFTNKSERKKQAIQKLQNAKEILPKREGTLKWSPAGETGQ